MARPSKLTPELREKLLQLLKAGNYISVACEYLHIDDSTFFRWMQKGKGQTRGQYRELYEAVKSSEAEAEVRAITGILTQGKSNWQALAWFLERKHPARWRKRDEVAHTGPGGGPVQIKREPIDLSALSDEELNTLEILNNARARFAGDGDPEGES